MKLSTNILDELKEISPLIAGMERVNVFTVPEGYFEGLATVILASLKDEESSLINSFSNQSSLTVPAGYFDSLADNIMARIKAGQNESAPDELRELSPMLYSIQNENVFKVPRGYFDELSDNILAQVKPQQTKVVNMSRRGSAFLKYAVAAVFTGVMALGVFKLTDNGKNSVDTIIAEGTQIAKENKFDEELAKITDADIVKYLEATGTDVNAAVVANSIDENELPSQEEYLMDEQALDNYLNSINVNDTKN